MKYNILVFVSISTIAAENLIRFALNLAHTFILLVVYPRKIRICQHRVLFCGTFLYVEFRETKPERPLIYVSP